MLQERLGLGQRQAQVLQLLVLFVQHDDVVDGYLLVIGDDHELQLETQRHTGDPQGRERVPSRYPSLCAAGS